MCCPIHAGGIQRDAGKKINLSSVHCDFKLQHSRMCNVKALKAVYCRYRLITFLLWLRII